LPVKLVHDMNVCRGLEVYLHSFLTSALDWGTLLTSRIGRFTTRKKPRTYWVGDKVDYMASLLFLKICNLLSLLKFTRVFILRFECKND
jgi:hypothetical protein